MVTIVAAQPRFDMTASSDETLLQLLEAARQGDSKAEDELYRGIYDELRRLARVIRRSGDTLDTTALVHEAYIRLGGPDGPTVQNRAHFFRLSAKAMRHVVCDDARRRSAGKRGGGDRAVTLGDQLVDPAVPAEELLALDDALEALATENPRHAAVVECRFFAGLTVEETAEAIDVSVPTVVRDWRFAQAWLSRRLDGGR